MISLEKAPKKCAMAVFEDVFEAHKVAKAIINIEMKKGPFVFCE